MSKIHDFFLLTTPPNVNHQLNWAETVGNFLFVPLAHAAGTWSIKTKENESLLRRKVFAIALLIITLPLSIIGCILKGLGQAWPHKKIEATDQTVRSCTPQQRVDECYRLLDMFNQICVQNGFCDEKGIPQFAIMGGTALGSEREQGMVPWDDDGDGVVFNEAGFLALEPKLNEAGLKINRSSRNTTSMYKIQFTENKFRELYPQAKYDEAGSVDIFIWSKMSDGSYTHDTNYARSTWPKDFIDASDFNRGFEWKQFGPLRLPGFTAQREYVERLYGKNCLTHGIQTHSHIKVCGIEIQFPKFGSHYFRLEKRQCALPSNQVAIRITVEQPVASSKA